MAAALIKDDELTARPTCRLCKEPFDMKEESSLSEDDAVGPLCSMCFDALITAAKEKVESQGVRGQPSLPAA